MAIKETEIEKERTKNKEQGQQDKDCGENKKDVKKLRIWRKEKEDEKKY